MRMLVTVHKINDRNRAPAVILEKTSAGPAARIGGEPYSDWPLAGTDSGIFRVRTFNRTAIPGASHGIV